MLIICKELKMKKWFLLTAIGAGACFFLLAILNTASRSDHHNLSHKELIGCTIAFGFFFAIMSLGFTYMNKGAD